MPPGVLIYCDYNAGALVRPEAADAVSRALTLGGNPSSVHGYGRRAKAIIEDARERVASSVGALAENVTFTSGATEALHLAIACLPPPEPPYMTGGEGEIRELVEPAPPSLIVSEAEHDAVFEQAKKRRPIMLRIRPDGLADLSVLEALLAAAPKPALVAVQLANNETGVIQPIAKIAAIARQHGASLLVDAAQALGRIPVDIANLDATYLVLSSHKIGGPPGAGALILAPGAPFLTTRFGGGQERGRRPGTENVAAIVGFGVAAEIAASTQSYEAPRLAALRDRFEANLPRNAIVFGEKSPRLPNTSNFALPGITAETAVIAMDLEGVAVSSGAACSSGKVRASRVLGAMGVEPDVAKSALRVSFGWGSSEGDVDTALRALDKIAAQRSRRGAA
ncbi:MAG TPA: cysteine desulfurase family protein [Caulobacterales bacterium]|nr:cysteine desulfurase family protein [Caulobacterales bacterium]